MASHFVVTLSPGLEKSAFRELERIAPDLSRERELKDGAWLVRTELPSDTFTAALVRADPVFVKHVMPVQAQVPLTRQKSVDLPVILDAARQVTRIPEGAPFAVQCRRVGLGFDYDAKDVEVFVGRFFESHGAIPRFSDLDTELGESQQIISVYLYEDRGYIGCSTVEQNLNEHIDEYRIYSRRPRQVSRAEFKLVEAVRKFRLHLTSGRALDLGAAPGGWTNVLAQRGMQVVAVDPAELAPRVQALANVVHFKGKAEDYRGEEDFDLLVNDMNVEPEQSADMMVRMARHIKPGAFAILTVKLVIRNPDKLLDNIRPVLSREFEILRVKNLFHNRQEVTLLLRKK